MDTLLELEKKARKLQQDAASLAETISELKGENDKKNSSVDFSGIMDRARLSPLKNHPLMGCKDELEIEAFLTLLSAVAMKGVGNHVQQHPLLYPCRIAWAIKKQTADMEEYFQKALTLDEKRLHQYIMELQKEHMGAVFILNVLLMILLYDPGNQSKMEFTADLAALFEISLSEMKDLLEIAKLSFVKSSILCLNLPGLCNEDFKICQYALQDYKILSVNTSDGFYCSTGGNLVELTPELEKQLEAQWKHIKKKKEVILNQVQLIRKESQEERDSCSDLDGLAVDALEGIFAFNIIDNLRIENSRFDHFLRPLFTAANVGKILITNSFFHDFTHRVFRLEQHTDQVLITLSTFQNCKLTQRVPHSIAAYLHTKRDYFACGTIANMPGLQSLALQQSNFLGISETTFLFSQGYIEDEIYRQNGTRCNSQIKDCEFDWKNNILSISMFVGTEFMFGRIHP